VWAFPGRNVILISESGIASLTLSVHSIEGVGGVSASVRPGFKGTASGASHKFNHNQQIQEEEDQEETMELDLDSDFHLNYPLSILSKLIVQLKIED